MSSTTALPQWDMEVVFPSLHSSEYRSAFDEIERNIGEMEHFFDLHGIEKGGIGDASVFDELVNRYNTLSEKVRIVNGYIHCFTSTDSRDQLGAARESEIDAQLVRLRKLSKRFTAWVGHLNIDELLELSETARAHEYALIKAKISAQHLMHHGEEMLASELEVSGMVAWAKMYSNITSQLSVDMTLDGESKTLPMSVVRSMAHEPDRQMRRLAYEAELAAWAKAEVPLCAAMNSIKGEVITLCKNRRWEDPLDDALLGANIDRETLDAMLAAAREAFPIFRRYMKAKAKKLGIERMAFYDLFAPIGDDEKSWEYSEACTFVAEQFKGYSQKLSDYAKRAFSENWIDAGSRPGKVDGAFCMGLRADESRILLNYKPAFGSVSTLAHELGHGYHNLCLANRTSMQRSTPMTLAETASIFCETIIRQAVLENGTPSEQLSVLEASLQGSCQVVVDITSRFLFEQGVFEARKKRELSAQEMCQLMKQTQIETYGDGLDPDALHPYMWAAKGHYYGRSYYNFPYMFGLLFGLGLYAEYQKAPESFKDRYDDLLSSTGLADAATLGKRFGIHIREKQFWAASLDQIRKDVDRFEALVG